MIGLLFIVIAALASAFIVIGLWLAICSVEPPGQGPTDPLGEALVLRMELHELAHDTRVEMIRAARDAEQERRVKWSR